MLKNIWLLSKDFFLHKETRKTAFALLSLALFLEGAVIYLSVLINQWNADFGNALVEYNMPGVKHSIWMFVGLVAIFTPTAVGKFYFRSSLSMKWREFMTRKYLDRWACSKAYYGFSLVGKTSDNPDQRISEDIKSFINLTLSLSIDLLSNIISLITFSVILYNISGMLMLKLFGLELQVKGYMMYAVVVYSLVGTFIMFKLGKKLAGLDYIQEQKEANFRFALMRTRENAEMIAFYMGHNFEAKKFKEHFMAVVKNFYNILNVSVLLNIWNTLYINIATIVPILLAFPKYFSKEILFGQLMQIRGAFGSVNDSLSFFISSFSSIASYKSVIKRLDEFNLHIAEWENLIASENIKISFVDSKAIQIKNLALDTPFHESINNKINMNLELGGSYLIVGKNGGGKSTLLRAIADMWPYGAGEIILPKNKKIFYIPQKPYMPEGSFAEILAYPRLELDVMPKELLVKLGIDYLIDRAMKNELQGNWAGLLSLGEQQKISIIRAIIARPDILVMDEATSALTIENEASVMSILKEYLPEITIISVGHRESLEKFHENIIRI